MSAINVYSMAVRSVLILNLASLLSCISYMFSWSIIFHFSVYVAVGSSLLLCIALVFILFSNGQVIKATKHQFEYEEGREHS